MDPYTPRNILTDPVSGKSINGQSKGDEECFRTVNTGSLIVKKRPVDTGHRNSGREIG